MSILRYHILYNFRDGPWGGGNQFLKALREALIAQKAYSDDIKHADALLFNSHHFGHDYEALPLLQKIKQERPHVPFIHRVDGPIKLVRGSGALVDRAIFRANALLADGTIFQTHWSKENSFKLGLNLQGPHTTIINAPNSHIFYADPHHKRSKKLRLISTSWAANKRKGFDIYKYLDDNLDFERYDMTFVGNSPFPFQNIKHIPPQDSQALAHILRRHDVYITASINDPCSNALCEGLHCGLPALIRNSGGHPEIARRAGLKFEGQSDVLEKIEDMNNNYETYRSLIDMPDISKIAQDYIFFAQDCIKALSRNTQRIVTPREIARIKTELKILTYAEHVRSRLFRTLKWGD